MATTPDLTFRMRIDTTELRRGFWDVQTVFTNMPRALRGRPAMPARPYPRDISRMTAREYRARRRRYAREMRAWRKADRIAAQRGTNPNFALLAEFAKAARSRKS